MEASKSFCVGVFVFLFFWVAGASAESLYVVDHSSNIYSFDVISKKLVFRKHLSLVPEGYGGVDLVIDDEYNILFMYPHPVIILKTINMIIS